jgi:hypothetical protein
VASYANDHTLLWPLAPTTTNVTLCASFGLVLPLPDDHISMIITELGIVIMTLVVPSRR